MRTRGEPLRACASLDQHTGWWDSAPASSISQQRLGQQAQAGVRSQVCAAKAPVASPNRPPHEAVPLFAPPPLRSSTCVEPSSPCLCMASLANSAVLRHSYLAWRRAKG